ncbi:prephenate dehydratase [Sandaracinus amylolyticus]|uniref:prephenate dehydratase n=1 Tax=Sandaracinus amylolyticus TaxID=927083 RepID=UPI001F0068F5|nr:prephenate dehydratase [Sandaracinus amylolyticus]UJR79335.1 Chorismate mutase and prephenate dehydratase [Sandaracinus amylolyticus]
MSDDPRASTESLITPLPTPENGVPVPDLALARQRIDSIDDRILDLLAERAEVVGAVRRAKQASGAPALDPEREKALLERLLERGAGRFPKPAILAVFREILSGCVSLQARVTVAYLGPQGTYSHAAARALFGYAPQYIEEATIDGVFESVRRGRAVYGVVPIENSTEGSVAGAIDALIEGGCRIRRELVLPIKHCLLSNVESLSEVRRVYSHPQALAQCRKYLANNLPQAQIVHTASTALAVREAGGDASGAAIGSSLAGEIMGVPVLREGIQDIAFNATRFVMIGKDDAKPTGRDRTTFTFIIADETERGALRRTLGVLEDNGVNMTRIESRPSRDRAWRYVFVIDVEGHREDENVAAALAALETRVQALTVLGSYPRYPDVETK